MSSCTRQQAIYEAAQRPEAAATFDFYGPIHKGLRRALSQLTVRLGSVDAADGLAVIELLADLRAQLDVSEGHLHHEDAVVHEALRQVAPGAVEDLELDHAHHRQTFVELQGLIGEVEAAADRAVSLRALYLAFTRFVADDFAHMAHEETEVLPVLQALFTDAELMDMHHQIMGSIPPEAMADMTRLIVPALRPQERLEAAEQARATLPEPVFEGLIAIMRSVLCEADALRLTTELGLPLAKAA